MSPDDRKDGESRPTPAAGSRVWPALVLEVPPHLADEITGRLAGLILGAQHRPSGPGATGIRLFLRTRGGAESELRRAEEILAEFGLEPAACGLRLERTADEPWVARYQAALRPLPLGRRFTVLPTGEGSAGPGREPILLAPGGAFGTGEHATTQLCAERLERHVRPGSRWLDLGCGTGILCIVARRCGAVELLGLDHDREAIEVAAEVLAANGLTGQVQLKRGSLEERGERAWSGVVANIHAPFFLEHAGTLRAALEPGGLLVASGFVVDQVDEIAAVLARAGLRELERRKRVPWVVWVGKRDDGAGGR